MEILLRNSKDMVLNYTYHSFEIPVPFAWERCSVQSVYPNQLAA